MSIENSGPDFGGRPQAYDRAPNTSEIERKQALLAIVGELDGMFDVVSRSDYRRREPIRSLIALAGSLLREEYNAAAYGIDDDDGIDPSSRELLMVAAAELGVKLPR